MGKREQTHGRMCVCFFILKNGGRMEKPKEAGGWQGKNREAPSFSREIGIRNAAGRMPTGTGGF